MSTDVYVRTFYVNRVLDLPPLVAQASYDALAQQSGGEGVLTATNARLQLHAPVRMPVGAGYQPYRSQPGTLMTDWLRWPFELELLPWSDDRTELGLRPISRRFSPFPPEPIVRAGQRLLSALTENLLNWAEQPLVDWANSLSDGALSGTS